MMSAVARPTAIWSGIEVVITGLTRNQVACKGSWVRIPPAPPNAINPNSITKLGDAFGFIVFD